MLFAVRQRSSGITEGASVVADIICLCAALSCTIIRPMPGAEYVPLQPATPYEIWSSSMVRATRYHQGHRWSARWCIISFPEVCPLIVTVGREARSDEESLSTPRTHSESLCTCPCLTRMVRRFKITAHGLVYAQSIIVRDDLAPFDRKSRWKNCGNITIPQSFHIYHTT